MSDPPVVTEIHVTDAPVERVRPQPGDGPPRLAAALGVAAPVLAPVVLWVTTLGVVEAVVAVLAVAAILLARSYRAGLDFLPSDHPSIRLAGVAVVTGALALAVLLLGALGNWVAAQWAQMTRLGTLFFNTSVIGDALNPLLTEGLRITLIVWIMAVLIGVVLGLLLSLAAISTRRAVRLPALVYIDIFRGLPAIVTITLIGIALPLSGFRPFGRNPIFYAGAALGLVATAYTAEIFRAGIQSIDKGQMEAARSLGLSYVKAMRVVIVPQGIRRVIPPLTNEAIALLKDTSLIFVIGLSANASGFFEGRDLYRVGTNIAQQTGNYSAVIGAALIYLVLTIPLTRLTNYLDRRLREGRPQATDDTLPLTVTGPGDVGP